MVEVVVGPVGGVDRRVLAVVELHQRDDVAQALGLLDRLRGHVDALDVVARALVEERHLAPALEVLLVQALADERHPRDPRLGDTDLQLREADDDARRDHAHDVGHDREGVARGVAGELGVEAVVVEREDRRGDGHRVQHHRQAARSARRRRSGRSGGGPTAGRAPRTAGRRRRSTGRRRSARSRARRPPGRAGRRRSRPAARRGARSTGRRARRCRRAPARRRSRPAGAPAA